MTDSSTTDPSTTDPSTTDPSTTDPTTRLAAFEPTESALRPPVLPPSDVSYVVEDTAVGRMLLARNDSGALVASAYVATVEDEDRVLMRISERVSPRVLRQPAELDEALRELESFLAGRTRELPLRTDLALASGFQRTVLPRLVTVGYGDRATYGELAARVERPGAARAVGAALGANPLCVVLPCHRIVASGGALTGYAGGLEAKRYLLELEASHRAG